MSRSKQLGGFYTLTALGFRQMRHCPPTTSRLNFSRTEKTILQSMTESQGDAQWNGQGRAPDIELLRTRGRSHR